MCKSQHTSTFYSIPKFMKIETKKIKEEGIYGHLLGKNFSVYRFNIYSMKSGAFFYQTTMNKPINGHFVYIYFFRADRRKLIRFFFHSHSFRSMNRDFIHFIWNQNKNQFQSDQKLLFRSNCFCCLDNTDCEW